MNAASILRSKIFAIASAGVIGAGLLGGVAIAATPSTTDAVVNTVADTRSAVADAEKAHGKLKAALDALVAKGVITQAQEDAILAAVAADHKDHPKLREFVGDITKASVDYLGVPAEQVKKGLMAGKSLGQIANETPGKSRDGLVDALDTAAGKRIDAAVDAGKITKEQAATLRPKVNEAIAKIVDHHRDPKAERSPKPAKTPKPTT